MKTRQDKNLQAILGTDDLTLITERVDDVALLIGLLDKNGFARSPG